ncbi:MAG: arginase family protein, partial [Phycisphaerales bacterium]|nr:arginase family protein [Phycisphaerales bacterium]
MSETKPPRTLLPDGRVMPRFAGICTFCRFPRLQEVLPAQRPLDWIVYGVPFDGGVTYRPGARFGPRAVREQSQYMKPFNLELDVNLAQRLSLADGGDAPVSAYSCRETVESVLAFARGLGGSSAEDAV